LLAISLAGEVPGSFSDRHQVTNGHAHHRSATMNRKFPSDAAPPPPSGPGASISKSATNSAAGASSGGAKRIGALVSQLMARRGYAQVFAAEGLQAIIQAEVGPAIAGSLRVGNVKRGVLHIYVVDSVTMQELTFRQRALLKRIQAEHSEVAITDLRFHISASATG